jgi:hypothetical protein
MHWKTVLCPLPPQLGASSGLRWNEWQWRRDSRCWYLLPSRLIIGTCQYLLTTLLSDNWAGIQKIAFCHKNAIQSGQKLTRNCGFLYFFGPLLPNLWTIFNFWCCKQYCAINFFIIIIIPTYSQIKCQFMLKLLQHVSVLIHRLWGSLQLWQLKLWIIKMIKYNILVCCYDKALVNVTAYIIPGEVCVCCAGEE